MTSAPDIRRATAREAHDLTGFAIGGIPPIGHDRPVRVIMDPDLGRYPVVWAAAGLSTTVFPVPPGTLRILANATVAPDRRGTAAGRGRARCRGRRDGPRRQRPRRRSGSGGRHPCRRLTPARRPARSRAAQRHDHLSRRPAGALALGRQRLGARGLRPVRGRRRADRPRADGRGRPGRPVPRRAPSRGSARRLDRPVRLAHPRRAAGAPLGQRRAARRRLRLPHLRPRDGDRRPALGAPLGDADPRPARFAAARARPRPGRDRDVRHRARRDGRLAGRPFRRGDRRRAGRRPARADRLRRAGHRARSGDGSVRDLTVRMTGRRWPDCGQTVDNCADPMPEPWTTPIDPVRGGPYRSWQPGGAERH